MGEKPAHNPLLAAAQAGDRRALEKLLAEEQSRIYSFGMKMCRNPEDAQDVLQDTMLAVARSIGDFRGEASLPTWLFQIARSYCIKKRRLRKGAPKATEELDDSMSDDAPSPEQTARSKEMEKLLNHALATLPPSAREVLVLRDVEGLSAAEVAEVVGSSVDAVKSKLHRARAALQKALQKDVSAPKTSECPDIVEMYSKHIEGDLTGSMCAQMEQHVAHCARCGSQCDALKQSLAICKTTPVVPLAVQQRVRQSLTQFLNLSPAKS